MPIHPAYERARAAVRFDDVARDLVHALKYGDRLDLAPTMGRWMANAGRAQNVQGAFRVPPDGKAEVVGRKLVLVDDVLTSGATIDTCTRALLRAGAACVDVLVFARVVAAVRTPI